MHVVLGSLAIIAATVIGAHTCAAQSAYDYPWCALRGGQVGGQACYYTSYQQCMATLRGLGGTCIANPAYRGRQPVVRDRYERY